MSDENQTENQTAELTETQPAERSPDPVSPSVKPEPAETIEDQGIAANEPYPTGNPRDPEDDFEAAHGFRRAK